MSEPTSVQKPSKVLIMGLDNSGKTSILISLKEDSNILSYFSLKPTKGLNIEKIAGPESYFSVWDFGGQTQYREDYLKKFDAYTDQTENLIYVIDIQAIDRYDLSLKYLSDIIKKLVDNNKKLKISIFLHKYDPNLKNNEKFKSIDETIRVKLISEIEKIIPAEFNYSILKTCIYTVFQKTSVKDFN